MLSEEALNRLSERLVQRTESLNSYMIKKLAEQIVDIGELTPSQLNEVYQSIKYGNDISEIIYKLSEYTDKNVEDIYKIFEEVAKKNQLAAKQFYEYKNINFIPYDENDQLQSIVTALARQTADTFINMSNTSAFAMLNSNGNLEYTKLSEIYQKITDEAILSIQTGRESYNQVMRRTMKTLAEKGITYTDYSTGYHRRLDSSVRMNVMDSVRQLQNTINKKFGDEFGADGIEVIHHKAPALDHSSNDEPGFHDIDGKQFSIAEFENINAELNRPVSTMNCYHTIRPIILGISQPLYSDAELEADKMANKEGFEYEGTKYTLYEGTQLQRHLETQIRKYRDRQTAATQLGWSEEVRHCNSKIKFLTNKYKEISEISGLPTRIQRLKIEKDVPRANPIKIYDTSINRNLYDNMKKTIKNVPNNYDEFLVIKYNNSKLFENMRKDYSVLKAINKNYKLNNKELAESLYYRYKENGMYVGDHAIETFIERSKNNDFTLEDLAKIYKKKPNYKHNVKGIFREIRYYDKIAIITENGKIVTNGKYSKVRKGWEPYEK